MALRKIALLAIVGLSAGGSDAADWSVGGTFSQNATLSRDADGDTALRGVSALGFRIAADTLTTNWRLNPTFRVIERIGDSGGDRAIDPRLGLASNVSHRRQTMGLNAGLSVSPEFVGDRDFSVFLVPDPDTGEIEETISRRDRDVLQLLIRGTAGADFTLDPRHTLSLGSFVRIRDIQGDATTLEDTLTYGGSLSLRRALSPALSGSVTASAQRFTSSDGGQSDSTTLSLSSGVSGALTPRHQGSLSISVSNTESDVQSRVSLGGGASLTYSLADTTYTLSANQSVQQGQTGEASSVFSVRAGVSHRINDAQRVSVSGAMNISDPVFGEGDREPVFVLSPRYELSLTRSWSVSLGYGLRIENGDELDNRVFVGLSRGFDLID